MASRYESTGWAWPGLSRRAHYFIEARSLCGKWFLVGVFDKASAPGPDDCAACVRKWRSMQMKPIARAEHHEADGK